MDLLQGNRDQLPRPNSTIVISTSPVPSNPSTEILENTIVSIQYHLPANPMIIMADGLRQEQREQSDGARRYQEFIKRIMLMGRQGNNTLVTSFAKHLHQAGMMANIIGEIKTPLIFFFEHDTPLLRLPIDFPGIERVILDKYMNCIRLHPLTYRRPEHEYLNRGDVELHGVPLIKTVQWSQRPHIATVEFYRDLLSHFSPNSNTFIEDHMYDYIAAAPWERYKVAIYNPAEGGIQRSEHTDARAGDPKFPCRF